MANCDLKLEMEAASRRRRRGQGQGSRLLELLSRRSLAGGGAVGGARLVEAAGLLPRHPATVASHTHKVFCGLHCGPREDMFVTAGQDCVIRLYSRTRGRKRLNHHNTHLAHTESLLARDVGWAVLDVAVSGAGDCLVYSSWSDHLHAVQLDRGEPGDRPHTPLTLSQDDGHFCIFSVSFSADDRELLGGANDGCIYIYDRGADRRTCQIPAHQADVNTVCFMDENTNVLASGADDGLVKVWDRRELRESRPRPVGELAGHVDGVAHVTSRGDGRHVASSSKDQSIKLWDVRRFSDRATITSGLRATAAQTWDYRRQRVPKSVHQGAGWGGIQGDPSLMTYRGQHTLLHTLIRCRFSPLSTTGQRYVYTGCATGHVVARGHAAAGQLGLGRARDQLGPRHPRRRGHRGGARRQAEAEDGVPLQRPGLLPPGGGGELTDWQPYHHVLYSLQFSLLS